MDKLLKVAVILSAVDQMSKVVKGATDKSIKELERMKKSQADMAKGAGLIAGGVAGFAALSVPVKAAADFETKLSDVRKVVQGLNDPKALDAFGAEIQQLGREIGIATNELVDLAAAGGRMDVPREHLIAYVRDVSKMSVAFDMAAGEVGENMGKIAKMFDIPINQIGKLGDTINYLDDNSIAKGKEIMDVMLRAAGTSKQIGVADENLAALASTFLTLGSRPEVAGTAINALMRELAIAEMQPKRFQEGLESIGISAQKMQSMMKMDPQGTILKVLDLIKNSKDGVTLSTQLFGKEYGDDIAKLAQGAGEYRRQLALLNDVQRKGSMNREFGIRNQTFNAELQKFNNIVQELKVNFGSALLPMLKEFGEVLKPIASGIADFVKNNPELTKAIGIFVAVSSAGLMVGGALMVASAAVSFFGATFAVATFGIPILIGAIIAGAYFLVKHWDKVKQFFVNLWNVVVDSLMGIWEWIKENWKTALFALINPFPLIFKGIIALIKKFLPELYEAGKNIIDSIVDGISNKAEALYNKVKELTQKVREFFPFSPAKRGPLMDIHKIKFAETLAMAIKPQPVMKAVGAVAGAMANGPSAQPIGGAGGGGSTINFAPVINLSGSATQADAKTITDTLRTEFKRLMEDYNRQKTRLAY